MESKVEQRRRSVFSLSLEQALRDAREQSSASREILHALGRERDGSGRILDTIIERAARLCRADAAQLFLVDGAVLRLSRLSGAVPEEWRAYVEETYGREGPLTMGDRDGRPIRYGAWEDGYQPEDPVDSAIMATRRAVFPGWGLDPFFD